MNNNKIEFCYVLCNDLYKESRIIEFSDINDYNIRTAQVDRTSRTYNNPIKFKNVVLLYYDVLDLRKHFVYVKCCCCNNLLDVTYNIRISFTTNNKNFGKVCEKCWNPLSISLYEQN